MSDGGRRVLLVADDAALRDVIGLILGEAGYAVEAVSPDAPVGEAAARAAADAILLEVRPTVPGDWEILDALQANPAARAIPVVAFSTDEGAAAEARASPNAREILVGAFGLDELLGGLARALGDPPPAAALPDGGPASPAAALAAEAIGAHARQVALAAVHRLLREEPYRSRFGEVVPGLVDNLGTLLGAILTGLRHGLAPDRVFAAPGIRRAIADHVRLRLAQGIDAAAAIREYHALRVAVDEFLEGLVGREGFTVEGAWEVSRRVADYVDALVGLVVADFAPGPRG